MVKLREKPLYGPGELPVAATAMKWDEIIVGEVMGPVDYVIKASTHQKHCDLLNIHDPWFERDGYLFPWEMFCTPRVVSRWKVGRMNSMIHHAMTREFLKPARVGEKLVGYVTVLDKYKKRDHDCFRFGHHETLANGEVVYRGTDDGSTFVDKKEPPGHGRITKVRQAENNWHGLGNLVKASRDLPVGLVLLTVTRGPLPMRISGFDQGGWSKDKWIDNIHEDAFAQRQGYAAGVVEGPIVWEFGLLQLLCYFFGHERFFTTGKLDTKVCFPGYVGDVIVSKARIHEKIPEGSGVRIVLETRVEKIDGTLCNIGTASALVD